MSRAGLWWGLGILVLATTPLSVVAGPPRPSTLEVAERHVVPLRRDLVHGTLEQRAFHLHGVPVRGAFETVRIEPEGAIRITAGRRPTGAPQVEPDEARIGIDALPNIVADALGLEQPARFESTPILVYTLVLDQPVLVWEVQLPLRTRPTPSRETLWISAMSGRVIDTREQVQSARARVFSENPSATPEPVEVELSGIDVEGPGHPLVGDRVVSLNCVVQAPAVPEDIVSWHDEGDCYPAHLALSDAQGDFFVRLPDVIVETDNVQAEDLYAEVSMYYHAERFLDAMRQKGVEAFKCETATMLANVRGLDPDQGSELDFAPLNNAYYTNQCDGEQGATMLFGQGNEVDFGYDGDVVYHELGHGMVATLTPEGLSGRRLRSDGAVVDAGGINEAIADYFTYLMTDDPEVGEYVGRFWSATSRPYVRSGENQKRCPDDTVGQVHNDGEPFAAALWAARSRIGDAMDAVVLEALTRMPAQATLEEGAAVLVQVADEARSRGELDAVDVDVLDRALRSRGLMDCPRVISDQAEVEGGRTMYLRKQLASVQPFVPGPMQLRYEVPSGATSVVVSYTLSSNEGSQVPAAHVLVKRADAPITFSYDLIGVDDPGDPTGEVGKIREVTWVRGDWDLEAEGEPDGDGATRATIAGLHEGEVLHLTLVAVSDGDIVASSVWVTTPGVHDDDATGTGDFDDLPGGLDEVRPGAAQAGGCGCTSGPVSPVPVGGSGLGVWALLAVRRRSGRRR